MTSEILLMKVDLSATSENDEEIGCFITQR